MRRRLLPPALVVAALLMTSCFLRPPYAIVVVTDPHDLAKGAHVLEISIAGGEWTRLPVDAPLGAAGLEITVVRESGEPGALRVRARQDLLTPILARGHVAALRFDRGASRAEVELRPPCDADAQAPEELAPSCADTPGCAGIARCNADGECHCGFCGDLIADDDEGCDDGNDNPSDGCDECRLTAWEPALLIGGGDAARDPRGAALSLPAALRALDDGDLLIADTGNARVLRWDAVTKSVRVVAGNGQPNTSGDGGRATSAGLVPVGLAVGPEGALYIADAGLGRVRRVGPDGIITTVLAAEPAFDDVPTSPLLWSPAGLAVEKDGALLIADAGSHFVLRLSASGEVTIIAGTGFPGDAGDGGLAKSASLNAPYAVALDGEGAIYVADSENHKVRRIDPRSGIIRTVAGTGEEAEGVDGVPATSSALSTPTDVAVGDDGRLYVADWGSHRVRRIDEDGHIFTVAGTGIPGEAREGSPAHLTALRGPAAVALVGDTLFVAEDAYVRAVDLDTTALGTLVGSGAVGEVSDGEIARAAPLSTPWEVAIDRSGALLLADAGHHRIRRVTLGDARPLIDTIIGTGRAADYGHVPEGEARRVDLYFPFALVEDPAGRLLFTTDYTVARYDPSTGDVEPIAGTGYPGTAYTGQAARDAGMEPIALALDGMDGLYVGTRNPTQVLRIDLVTGLVEVVLPDVSRLEECTAIGGERPAQCIELAADLVVLPDGRVAVADTQGHRVVALSAGAAADVIAGRGVFELGAAPAVGEGALETPLTYPTALALTPSGDLLVGLSFHVARLSGGVVAEVYGSSTATSSGEGGPASEAGLDFNIGGLALDGEGNLFITESERARVRRVDAATGIITTVVGAVEPAGLGPFEGARLLSPRALARLPSDRYLVAGGASGRLLVADLADEELRLAAGFPGGQPIPATGSVFASLVNLFGDAAGVAYDPWLGVAYVSDGNRGGIARVDGVAERDTAAWKVSATAPYLGSGARPTGMALQEAERTLYVADAGRSMILSVHVDTGEVRAVAGTGAAGFGQDAEPLASARFDAPEGIAVGPDLALYVADTGNHRVRRIDRRAGLVTTVLGNGDAADSGSGSPASSFPVARPVAVALDRFGNLFVAAGSKVREIFAGADGRAGGDDTVRVIHEATEGEEACFSGLFVAADDTLHVVDECRGVLLQLSRGTMP